MWKKAVRVSISALRFQVKKKKDEVYRDHFTWSTGGIFPLPSGKAIM